MERSVRNVEELTPTQCCPSAYLQHQNQAPMVKDLYQSRNLHVHEQMEKSIETISQLFGDFSQDRKLRH